ncbi:MAG: rod shape-determining protein MreD [Deltaproteobacteria bacterium]|nr:rod shape-determining protein MreD [Deltaproteobacteria bacterium]MBW2661598.1 rod shape-determining protein MreD [Deltaproteobacteria bacterium]
MTYCFHVCTCLCLVIIQTTIIPCFTLFDNFPDLLAIFIIFLGLFRKVREGIPAVFLLGFVMDSISGSPLWMYVTIYFWLFVCVKWLTKYLHAGDYVLLLFVVIAGVLIENAILLGTVALLAPASHFHAPVFKTVVIQVLLAVCTGPFMILFYNYIYKGWDKRLDELAVKRNGF